MFEEALNKTQAKVRGGRIGFVFVWRGGGRVVAAVGRWLFGDLAQVMTAASGVWWLGC